MVGFAISCRVEPHGPHRFRVRAEALPFDVELRCAPEERCLVCASERFARRAQARLARALAHDVLSRGNRVVEQCCGDESGCDGAEPASPSGDARDEDLHSGTNG